jgi:hypothetical protein
MSTESSNKETDSTLVRRWRDNLLLDEHRAIYDQMTREQQLIVLFALRYPTSPEEIALWNK